jgi:hypothetical protein
MKTTMASLTVLAILLAIPFLLFHRAASAQGKSEVPALATLELTGPYAYRNLAVFVVHDRKAADHQDILTLDEALAKGTVTVAETGNVNQLAASNKGKTSVYLQSGDIVKGGKQDRVLQHDAVLPPNSKKVPLAVFCVESGRWHSRGDEPVHHFASSKASLVTKKSKLAVKVAGNQSEVWEAVANAQVDIGNNVGRSVRSVDSETSLQLTLEDKKLGSAMDEYVGSIEKQIPRADDVVGYALAINGEVESVDVFASPKLFGRMKGKLLKSGATEAIAAKQDKVAPPPGADAVRKLIADAESGAARSEKRTLRTQVNRNETKDNVVFTTEDPLVPAKPLHKSYMKK